MIEDSYIYNEFRKFESIFHSSLGQKSLSPFHAQMGLGITGKEWKNQKYPASCKRHKLLFNSYSIIPRYCFDCYKIEINPSTVLELFKLMFLFNEIDFDNNNHRKLFLRPRQDIPVNYAGLIYFQSLSEAKKTFEKIKSIIDSEIRPDIPIKLKRGCTEFNQSLSNYYDINENYDSLVFDKDKWREIELKFDQSGAADVLPPLQLSVLPSIAEFNLYHYVVMRTWLSFARSIGDDTYLKVTETPLD